MIGDIDVLVSAAEDSTGGAIMERFVSLPDVSRIVARGDTHSTVELDGTISCDLRIVADAEFPFALNYFTGSKEHNVEMRSRARKIGLSLNEYAFTPIEEGKKKRPRIPAVKTEEDLYGVLGLAYIPPELRENTKEFEAAEKDAIPTLIEESDLRGTFHCHTTYSDGVNTLDADGLGCAGTGMGVSRYRRPQQVRVLCRRTLARRMSCRQVKEIDALNAETEGVHGLQGDGV